ncbi:MAG: cobalamin-binding protein [Candidatus Omnitrophica bacterium]|nr:cobalamin-binding protein [Candidatus Omnitrophota bacterium]
MRICSLLPSATETVYALGLGDQLAGVSHECDVPPDALRKPRVLRTTLERSHRSSADIDAAVRRTLSRGEPLFALDEEALRRAQPDLIITQELCDVCAIGAPDVIRLARALATPPRILSLHPHTLEEVLGDIRAIGEAIGCVGEAERLIARSRQRLARVRALVAGAPRPAVFCLEWLQPPMAAGHWVPEMVACAGGREILGRSAERSRYVTWEEVAAGAPEVLVVMPCGVSPECARRELALWANQPWWSRLPAVRSGRVHLVDGSAYFNRPGPRLIDGIELLAGLLHPGLQLLESRHLRVQ